MWTDPARTLSPPSHFKLAPAWANLPRMFSLKRKSKNVRRRSVSVVGSGMIAASLFIATTVISVTVGGQAVASPRGRSSVQSDGAAGASHRQGREGKKKRRSKEDSSAPESAAGLPFAISRPSHVTPNQGGRIVVFPFPGDDGTLSTQVSQLLAARGLDVLTDVKPVDSAEQYREVATTLRLAAFVEGDLKGTEEKAKAVVRVRSGYSGRKMVEVSFKDKLENLPREISDRLWVKLGPSVAHACVEASRPRRKTKGALVINAGTPIETIPAPPKAPATNEATPAPKAKPAAAERKAPPVENPFNESA